MDDGAFVTPHGDEWFNLFNPATEEVGNGGGSRKQPGLDEAPLPGDLGMTIMGGCRCGAVSYTLAIDALPATYACHCLDCQTWSGSAFAQHAMLPEAVIAMTGPVVSYEHEGTGGRTSCQRVCGVCHTRIYNTDTAVPGMAVLRAGTLADSHLLNPIAHIWAKRKQPWVVIPEGVPSWPESPSPEEFAAAVRRGRGA